MLTHTLPQGEQYDYTITDYALLQIRRTFIQDSKFPACNAVVTMLTSTLPQYFIENKPETTTNQTDSQVKPVLSPV